MKERIGKLGILSTPKLAFFAGLLGLGVVAAEMWLSTQSATSNNSSLTSSNRWQVIEVQSGDSLSRIFHTLNLPNQTLEAVMSAQGAQNTLQLITPGDKLFFHINADRILDSIKYPLSEEKTLLIEKKGDEFVARILDIPLLDVKEFKSGVIHHSLAAAASIAGLNAQVIQQLSQLFSSRINFTRAVQPGDTFSVLYDNYYANGKKVKTGDILAAQFVHQGKTYHVVRYTDPKGHTGFYTLEGQNTEIGLDRFPVHYKRISSKFTYHRMDPVLHRIHTHLGVDLAAPWGSPIHALGDGSIRFMGNHGGYGNAAIIQYGPHYRTLYGHMSRFAPHLHNGAVVKKGQVIGYVGSTGWSTGPHLHLTVWKDGVVQDPLTVQLPGGPPVAGQYMSDFRTKAKNLIAQLELHKNPEFAQNQLPTQAE
ncbi:MAG TPA: peptidoglycan DD-metalloendopeptidase family protein [Coxiellaceae bacterium]|nr:peptidoglycan DD-metalloendopeptidase family protein [Coxiellaceae bacterium]